MSVAWVGVAATVATGAMSASASNKASKGQQQAANSDRAMQMEQFDKQTELQAPFQKTGVAANSRLATLLGVNSAQPGHAKGQTLVDTSGNTPRANADLYANNAAYKESWDKLLADHTTHFGRGYSNESDAGEIEQAMQTLMAPHIAAEVDGPVDPEYGSLLRNFTAEDLNADPVYQSGLKFGLDEGVKGIERQQGATGSRLSGATLKALARFGTDYGSTKANESRSRFKDDQNSIYNKLAGVSGAGQQATNQIANSSQQFATNMSNNITSAANARGASSIAQGNSWQNGINSAVSGYRNSQPVTGNGVSQALFSQTPTGGAGFGTGYAYGNQDLGQYL